MGDDGGHQQPGTGQECHPAEHREYDRKPDPPIPPAETADAERRDNDPGDEDVPGRPLGRTTPAAVDARVLPRQGATAGTFPRVSLLLAQASILFLEAL